ncbi:hypothetical protein [Sphingobacterium mizutaii]|uniref:hypothetical protein n=1 Tax=Sphingobacterium mizutaii TaxID=1010 RepID=UPI001625DDCB|nr:hypothetical protein [Sphingobacterium mizutaii]
MKNKPDVLYRFFGNENHAQDFLRGKIRLSTLYACRTLENKIARDENEGAVFMKVDSFTTTGVDKKDNQILRNLGIGIQDHSGGVGGQIKLINIRAIQNMNAHVLCFTKSISDYIIENFGKYGVQIIDPYEFLLRVHFELRRIDPNYLGNDSQPVIYNDNNINFKEPDSIQLLGFSKNREKFELENEYRLLFGNRKEIEPKFIEIGNITDIASYIEIR